MYIRTYFPSEEEILFETSITLYKPPKTALDVSRNANTKPLEKPTLKSPLSPSPPLPPQSENRLLFRKRAAPLSKTLQSDTTLIEHSALAIAESTLGERKKMFLHARAAGFTHAASIYQWQIKPAHPSPSSPLSGRKLDLFHAVRVTNRRWSGTSRSIIDRCVPWSKRNVKRGTASGAHKRTISMIHPRPSNARCFNDPLEPPGTPSSARRWRT